MADKKLALIDAQEGTTSLAASPTVVGRTKSAVLHWSKLAAETDTHVIYLMPVLSTDRITGIYRKGAALTGATDVNIGLYSSASTPVDVDENLIGDAVSIAAAATAWTQIDELANADVGKTLWELLGLTAPVDRTYYLAITLITGGTATGDQAFRVDFLI